MNRDDVQLIRRVVAGEDGAYPAFMAIAEPVVDRRLRRAMERFPTSSLKSEDLKQEFFMMLLDRDYKVLRSFEGRSALTTFIHAIATRFFWRRARDTMRQQTLTIVDDTQMTTLPDPAPSPQEHALRKSQVAAVRAALAELSDTDLVLVKMLFEQDSNAVTVARLLGISAAGVRMKKKRLLAKLEVQLAHLNP